jgi:hypothetical protein
MSRNGFSLHCALLRFHDLVTRRDKGNGGKLQATQSTAANFTKLMEHLSFHAHTMTEDKLDIDVTKRMCSGGSCLDFTRKLQCIRNK